RPGALLPCRDLVEAAVVSTVQADLPCGLGSLRRRLRVGFRSDCATRLSFRGAGHGVAFRRMELAHELGAAGAAYASPCPLVRRRAPVARRAGADIGDGPRARAGAPEFHAPSHHGAYSPLSRCYGSAVSPGRAASA